MAYFKSNLNAKSQVFSKNEFKPVSQSLVHSKTLNLYAQIFNLHYKKVKKQNLDYFKHLISLFKNNGQVKTIITSWNQMSTIMHV